MAAPDSPGELSPHERLSTIARLLRSIMTQTSNKSHILWPMRMQAEHITMRQMWSPDRQLLPTKDVAKRAHDFTEALFTDMHDIPFPSLPEPERMRLVSQHPEAVFYLLVYTDPTFLDWMHRELVKMLTEHPIVRYGEKWSAAAKEAISVTSPAQLKQITDPSDPEKQRDAAADLDYRAEAGLIQALEQPADAATLAQAHEYELSLTTRLLVQLIDRLQQCEELIGRYIDVSGQRELFRSS